MSLVKLKSVRRNFLIDETETTSGGNLQQLLSANCSDRCELSQHGVVFILAATVVSMQHALLRLW
jgi:hypothetical protein